MSLCVVFCLRALIAKICGDTSFKTFPSDNWEKIFLFAMLLSIICAYTFYADFPRSYQNLEMGDFVSQVINYFLPYFQIMLGIASILSIGKYDLHMIATLGYFFVFLIWDILIIMSKPKVENKGDAEQFQEDAKKYFWTIDLPTFATFVFMLLIVYFLMKEESEHNLSIFMSGVIGSQAIAAAIGIVIRFELSQFFKKTLTIAIGIVTRLFKLIRC